MIVQQESSDRLFDKTTAGRRVLRAIDEIATIVAPYS
jgi:hypothetical protein